jgi:hypothetical protein
VIALLANHPQSLQSNSAAVSASFSDGNVPLNRSLLPLCAARQELPAKAKARPTIEELREYLDYEQESGVLRWKKASGHVGAGAIAGGVCGNGYWYIRFKRTRLLAHRVAFALHHGRWPHPYCDHADGNPLNNCADNLRECSASENAQNKRISQRNVIGIKGVDKCDASRGWRARVRLGKKGHAKYFRRLEDAAAYVKQLREQLHGEFARH